MKDYVLEACVDSVESAIEAKRGGATRLEMCGNLIIGGTTPEYELFEQVKEETGLETRILMRPRFGDFAYSVYEVERMEKQIARFKELGADGVVIGVLKTNGELDTEAMKRLIDAAAGIKVTLHRAFDVCRDPFEAFETAKRLGVNTILTSGQEGNCLKGKEVLKQLLAMAGEDVEILVGAGVNASVIEAFVKDTKAKSFHMSGKQVLESSMEYRNDRVNMGLPGISEYDIWRTSCDEIRKAVEVLERN